MKTALEVDIVRCRGLAEAALVGSSDWLVKYIVHNTSAGKRCPIVLVVVLAVVSVALHSSLDFTVSRKFICLLLEHCSG